MEKSIRKNDQVVVIAGKNKGQKGKVILVEEKDGKVRVTVEGVNIVVKHKKARSAQQKSAREKKAGAVDVSNVQIICGKCGKATRVKHKTVNGKKNRICSKCGETLDRRYVKTKAKAEEAAAEAPKTEEKEPEKKVLQRREVKHTAESRVKLPTNVNKNVMGHRNIGGGE